MLNRYGMALLITEKYDVFLHTLIVIHLAKAQTAPCSFLEALYGVILCRLKSDTEYAHGASIPPLNCMGQLGLR